MIARPLLGPLACLAVASALVACGSTADGPPRAEPAPSASAAAPDFATYQANVDQGLARGCGTLDCHGSVTRPYRIYGFGGLRLSTEASGPLASGRQPTTAEETRANYDALLALDAEELGRVVSAQDDPTRWRFFRKALALDPHDGGTVMAEDDPRFRCVVGWLRGMTERARAVCAEAAAQP